MITIQKDSVSEGGTTRRINIRNIIPLDNFVQKSYDNVTIEINGKSNLNELQELLKEDGATKIQIRVKRESKVYVIPRKYSGDCGAQIAWTGALTHKKNADIDVKDSWTKQSWRLDSVDVLWRE